MILDVRMYFVTVERESTYNAARTRGESIPRIYERISVSSHRLPLTSAAEATAERVGG